MAITRKFILSNLIDDFVCKIDKIPEKSVALIELEIEFVNKRTFPIYIGNASELRTDLIKSRLVALYL